jgi:hypothetical protein
MPLIREQLMELEGILKTVYDMEMKNKKDYIPTFFNEEKSSRSEEKHFGIGSIGLMKPWTGSVSYDKVGKRWVTTYRHLKYSNGLQIEREVVQFQEYGEVKRQTKQLAYSVYLTRQSHGMSVFNNAFDTAYAGADGKPLCAASGAGHPYSPENTSDTQFNAAALDLTSANLDKVRTYMIEYKDDRGNILGVQPDAIIYGNYYWKKVEELLGSDKEPYVDTNTKNVWSGAYKKLYCPWVTGKRWFLVDTSFMKMFLNWYNARKPSLEYEDNFNSEVGSYKTVGMWSWNFDEWFWIFGNNVA